MSRLILRIKKLFHRGQKVGSEGFANLTCLVYTDSGYHIAHCLEFDIVAQGATREEAVKCLAELIFEQAKFAIEHDTEHTSLFHPAPGKYWKDFGFIKSRMVKKDFMQQPPSRQDIMNRLSCIPTHA